MKRLLFIAGPHNGEMHDVPEGQDFESPKDGTRYRFQSRVPGFRMPVMVAEYAGHSPEWSVTHEAVLRFFKSEARRHVIGDGDADAHRLA